MTAQTINDRQRPRALQVRQGMDIGREECKDTCEGDPTCGGIFGSGSIGLGEVTEKSGEV